MHRFGFVHVCLAAATLSVALVSPVLRAADGAVVYRATCSTCHDSGAGAAPRVGRPEEWSDRFQFGRAALHESALLGIASTAMAAKGGFNQLSAEEVRAAVDFILLCTGFVEPTKVKSRVLPTAPQTGSSDVSDAVITARVAAALRSQMASANAPIDVESADLIVRGVGVRVGTSAGVVRLMGLVQDAVVIKRAEAIARSVDGVRNIDNRLVSGGMPDFD